MVGFEGFARFVTRARMVRGRAPEVGVLKGSSSRPRSISTYIMGGGMFLIFIGIFFTDILILFPGAVLFVVGLVAAITESVFER